MGFKKPSRAAPVRLGPYQAEPQRGNGQFLAAKVLGGAVVAGVAIGFLSSNAGSLQRASRAGDVAVSEGWRSRASASTSEPGRAAVAGNGAMPVIAGSSSRLSAYQPRRQERSSPASPFRKHRPVPGVYYSGCNEARAAGVAPIYAGEPGYRPEMDGDGDGIACEPHRGLR
jgi:hypothetical protein